MCAQHAVNSWAELHFPQPSLEARNKKSIAIDAHEIELEMRIN